MSTKGSSSHLFVNLSNRDRFHFTGGPRRTSQRPTDVFPPEIATLLEIPSLPCARLPISPCRFSFHKARPKSLNAIVTELGHIVNLLGGDPRPQPYDEVG